MCVVFGDYFNGVVQVILLVSSGLLHLVLLLFHLFSLPLCFVDFGNRGKLFKGIASRGKHWELFVFQDWNERLDSFPQLVGLDALQIVVELEYWFLEHGVSDGFKISRAQLVCLIEKEFVLVHIIELRFDFLIQLILQEYLSVVLDFVTLFL